MMQTSNEGDAREVRERKLSLEPGDVVSDIVQDPPGDSSSNCKSGTRVCAPQDTCDDPENCVVCQIRAVESFS